ncbi:hypothetical protein [Kitasatospora herbaricolor]|uniref:Uncharacterized protein n=1 Tax=Kitasatospora herbaricolor TaxID=68217 RepID=A0ABZ1WLU4_9ACTN|nr:hypothetical protein [Kitasatospora herbaricolor]
MTEQFPRSTGQGPTPIPPQRPRPTGLRHAAEKRLRLLTAPGGALHQRRQDVIDALEGGWGTAALWVRITGGTLALTAGALLLATVGGILLNTVAAVVGAVHLPTDLPAQGGVALARTITDPVRQYLDAHVAGLRVDGATAYLVWKTTGLVVAAVAFAGRATTARLAWAGWSAATIAMVWTATDPAGRPVAAGITAVAIAAGSLFALRGLSFSLRPAIHTRTDIAAPTIHVTIPAQPGPDAAAEAAWPTR